MTLWLKAGSIRSSHTETGDPKQDVLLYIMCEDGSTQISQSGCVIDGSDAVAALLSYFFSIGGHVLFMAAQK